MGKVDENVPVTSQQASYELPPRFDHRHRRHAGTSSLHQFYILKLTFVFYLT